MKLSDQYTVHRTLYLVTPAPIITTEYIQSAFLSLFYLLLFRNML